MSDGFNVINAPFGDIVYRYDDSFEGLMTAVFESYSRKPAPMRIVGQQYQRALGEQCIDIESDQGKAGRVIRGIQNIMGDDEYERVWTCFLSCNPDKADVIYRYIRLGMKLKRALRFHITNENVAGLYKLVSLIKRETSHIIEFIRFSRIEDGIYYAKISPGNDILQLIMPYFASRFNTFPFIIHDTGRMTAGVYDTREWIIRPAENLTLPDCAADELEFRALWKRFYDTIAIRERVNYKLHRQLMPKKFWKNITEMTVRDSLPPTLLPSDISRQGSGETKKIAPGDIRAGLYW